MIAEVRLRGKVVGRIKQTWFASTAAGKTVALAWKVPAGATGLYQHCVRAVDRAGNTTPRSCARIALR